jgi:tetratricopeptide (TPR) repeat protein
VASYRRAVELEPDRVDYLLNLGAAEMVRGNLDESLAVLLRAQRKDPEHPDVYVNLGSLYGKAGRPRESLAAFQRAAELGAQGPGLAVGQVLGHALLGEMEEARRILAEARTRYPEDPELRSLEADLR